MPKTKQDLVDSLMNRLGHTWSSPEDYKRAKDIIFQALDELAGELVGAVPEKDLQDKVQHPSDVGLLMGWNAARRALIAASARYQEGEV